MKSIPNTTVGPKEVWFGYIPLYNIGFAGSRINQIESLLIAWKGGSMNKIKG
jgi:hypothetical protein